MGKSALHFKYIIRLYHILMKLDVTVLDTKIAQIKYFLKGWGQEEEEEGREGSREEVPNHSFPLSINAFSKE